MGNHSFFDSDSGDRIFGGKSYRKGAVYSSVETSKASQAAPSTFWADKAEELAWAVQQCPKRDGWEITLGTGSPRSSTRFFVLKKGHKRGWETYAPGCKSDSHSDCGFKTAAEAVECYKRLFADA